MTITIWGKTINIDDKLLEEYKKIDFIELTDNHWKHLAFTSGTDEKSNEAELKKAIEYGMVETLTVNKRIPDILQRYTERSS